MYVYIYIYISIHTCNIKTLCIFSLHGTLAKIVQLVSCCIWLHVFVYVCMHTCMYVRIITLMHMLVCVYVCMYVCVCVFMCMHANHARVHVHLTRTRSIACPSLRGTAYVCMHHFVQFVGRRYAHLRVYTHVCTYIHTYIHTYIYISYHTLSLEAFTNWLSGWQAWCALENRDIKGLFAPIWLCLNFSEVSSTSSTSTQTDRQAGRP